MVRISAILKRAKEGKEAKESEGKTKEKARRKTKEKVRRKTKEKVRRKTKEKVRRKTKGKAEEKRQKKPPFKPGKSEVSHKSHAEKIPQQPQSDLSNEEEPKKIEGGAEDPKILEVRISPIIAGKYKSLDKEENMKLYLAAVSSLTELKRKALADGDIGCPLIMAPMGKLINQLMLDASSVMQLMECLTTPYLYSHAINVSILSVIVGLGLGYDKVKLSELACAASLHDIGMVKFIDLANKPRKLTVDEYNEIKKHTVIGAEILKKSKDLPETAVYAALQQHERVDGSGYPYGIKGESIDPNVRIICLADVYEATTHPRAYRKKFKSSEVIQNLLEDKHAFEHNLIKVLIQKIGIFTIGSFVQLNTKEIGIVARINDGLPLRPVVNIIYDRENKKLDHTKVVDLANQHTIYIKKEVIGNGLDV